MNGGGKCIVKSLIEQAVEIIQMIFSDTSVSKEQTIDSLKELNDELIVMINCLEEDL